MKKLISLILALTMILSLSVSAMAVTNSGDSASSLPDTTSITVGATFSESEATQPDAVYSVKISWTTPTITYTANAATYKWNATSLKYEKTDGTDGTWSANNAITITVENRSDAKVYASVRYVDKSDDGITSGATWKIDESEYTENTAQEIGSAAIDSNNSTISYTDTTSTGTAQTCVFTGNINVTAGSISTNTENIGTISVTLSKESTN